MRTDIVTCSARTLIASLAFAGICSFASAEKRAEPVTLLRGTSLPGIVGDFDFLAVDLKRDHLFVAAEEHHTLEVFQASTGKHLQSVPGVKTPTRWRMWPTGTSCSWRMAATPRA